MQRIIFIALFSLLSTLVAAQRTDTWNLFAKTKFEPKFDEKLGEYLYHPLFPEEIRKMEGKVVTIEGFYVPFSPQEDDYIILSKFPMSQCFFCGGGGPESVAEVKFAKDPGRFKVDDLITVRGILKLNSNDLDHLNFIVTGAELVRN